MGNKILVSFIFGMLLIGTISAMDITFYYSDSCSYCQEIKPFVMDSINKYPTYHFNLYETSNKYNYNSFLEDGFTGVPAFKIITDDCREIKFIGANQNKLNCELQQMTTKDCPTISADTSVGGSWFMN